MVLCQMSKHNVMGAEGSNELACLFIISGQRTKKYRKNILLVCCCDKTTKMFMIDTYQLTFSEAVSVHPW